MPSKSILYSIPYLIFVFFLYKLAQSYEKNLQLGKRQTYRHIGILMSILFLIFFGLRGHILSDSMLYLPEFEQLKVDFSLKYILNASSWWEPGFVFYSMVIKSIYNNFHFWIFVNTLTNLLLLILCVKRYSNRLPIQILAFFAFFGLILEINLFRNSKAIYLFVLSLDYVKNRNFIKFLILNLVGATVHSSALIYIPLYWLYNKRLKFLYILPILTVVTYIFLMQIDVTSMLFERLFNMNLDSNKLNALAAYYNQSEEQVLSIGTIERLSTLVFSSYLYVKNKAKDVWYDYMYFCFLIYYITFSLFGMNFVFRDRIPTLFIFSYWFIYPYFYEYLMHYKLLRCIIILFLFAKVTLYTINAPAYYENLIMGIHNESQRTQINAR